MLKDLLSRCDDWVNEWVVNHAHNIRDLRKYAKLRVPRPMFHYMDGAAEDEATLDRNCSDFARYDLKPRYLVDVSEVDTTTKVLGQTIDLPLIFAPTGMNRLFNNDGEMASSRAASEANLIYSLSSMGTHSIEEVAEVCDAPKMYQIYVFRDRSLVQEFMDRAKACNYAAMCLTIDVPVPGNRERDLYTGMTLPPKLTLSSWLDFALHPLWGLKYVTSKPFQLANVAHRAPVDSDDVISLVGYLQREFDPSVTWDDAAWMTEYWDGPFAIKGICCADDAVRAADMGASAVIVSNHGGRQLDYAPSPVSVLTEVVDAVGDRVEVILDGGIRRGTDVVKALALGADACMMGRAYLFGLGAAGYPGVTRTLDILRREIVRDMALLGTAKVEDISREHIRDRSEL
ncbi:MAG: alpha-hydroxy acid oxidase [Pseudomonadota bacterium]